MGLPPRGSYLVWGAPLMKARYQYVEGPKTTPLPVPSGAWVTHRPPPPSALAVSILAVSPSDLPGISCKSDAIGPGDFRVGKPGVAVIQGLAHKPHIDRVRVYLQAHPSSHFPQV